MSRFFLHFFFQYGQGYTVSEWRSQINQRPFHLHTGSSSTTVGVSLSPLSVPHLTLTTTNQVARPSTNYSLQIAETAYFGFRLKTLDRRLN